MHLLLQENVQKEKKQQLAASGQWQPQQQQPTSPAGNKSRSAKKRGKAKHKAAAAAGTSEHQPATTAVATAGADGCEFDLQWHQAYDAASGYYYYYNAQLQVCLLSLSSPVRLASYRHGHSSSTMTKAWRPHQPAGKPAGRASYSQRCPWGCPTVCTSWLQSDSSWQQ
jgi:hypothetical protein